MRRIALALVVAAAGATPAYPLPGDVDTTFGVNGVAPINFPGGPDRANAVAIQSDGKIVLAGSANNGRNTDFAIVRLNADGTLDSSFGANGRVLLPVGNGDDAARAVVIDSQGRIVVAGTSTDTASPFLMPDIAVARLTASGAPDGSFGANGRFILDIAPGSGDIAYSVAVDASDRIVVGGSTSYFEEGPPPAMVNALVVLRLTAGGALDEAFAEGGAVLFENAGLANAVAVDAAGRIVVAGPARGETTLDDFAVFRLDASGEADSEFAGGAQVLIPLTTADDTVTAVALDSQGRIVLGGYAEGSPHTGFASGTDFAAVRLLDNGSVDGTFGNAGVAMIPVGTLSSGDFVRAIASDGSDRIILAGATHGSQTFNQDIAVVRLTAAGMLDGSFGSGGKFITAIGAAEDSAMGAALDVSGRIVVAGWTYTGPAPPATGEDFLALRLTAGGALDGTFGQLGKITVDVGFGNAEAVAMAIQPDDKVVVAGWCSACGASRHTAVARLNADGMLDPSFADMGRTIYAFGVNEDRAHAIALDGTGKIVVAGDALPSEGPGIYRTYAVSRLNSDGSPDTGFGASGKTVVGFDSGDARAAAIAIDAAGRLVLAGGANAEGEQRFSVVRLLPNGNPDGSFGASGKVFLSSVPPPGQGGRAFAVLVDDAGRVVLGGSGATGFVVRLLENGELDPSFGTDGVLEMPNGMLVNAIAQDSSGHILAAGSAFNDANGIDVGVARIDSNGSLDRTFGNGGVVLLATVPGGGPEIARSIRSTSRGRILVAGEAFESGQSKFLVARLNPAGTLDATFGSGGYVLASPAPGNDVAFAVGTQSTGAVVVAGTSGETGSFQTDMAVIRLADGSLPPGDFTADGRSDVLWRNQGLGGTGENYLYPLDGLTILGTEGYLRTLADLNWSVVGIGDFDGDGKADILWRNSGTGENYVYFMDGTTIKPGEGYIRTVADPNWQVAGVGDFDGDGRDDILWRNSASGENYLYPMDGLAIKPGEGYLRTVADLSWKIAGVGDLDGNGKADVLWRNVASGENYAYLMNGTAIANEGYLRTVADQDWQVAGLDDFDGDAKDDILWRNASTGENYLYPMDGSAIKPGEGYLRTVVDLSWQVRGTGDYDGDGKADVLWRHANSGENYLYPMEGTIIKPSEGYLRTVPQPNWQVAK
jgi:uncharacterized delta-60 repeat protein